MRFGAVAIEFMPAVQRILTDGVPDFSRLNLVDIVREVVGIEHIEVVELTMEMEHMVPGSITPEVISKLVDLKDELGHSTQYISLYGQSSWLLSMTSSERAASRASATQSRWQNHWSLTLMSSILMVHLLPSSSGTTFPRPCILSSVDT